MRALSLLALLAALTGASSAARAADSSLPRIESKDGRHALIVDGAPFLMLGVQANNSSNYPEPLTKVWPMMDRLHANTLEIPVAWEQLEPVEGQFDFSWVDHLLGEARKHDRRLVLLWFATWKNTGFTYAPEWVKADGVRFPRMRKPDGSAHTAMSPHGLGTLAADKRAFVALMRHLHTADTDHRVIMVQVENEAGSYDLARDHAPAADALFKGQVPAKLLTALRKPAGTWSAVFGPRAEQFFTTWYFASYINEIAAAGRAAHDVPMYVNSALGDAFTEEKFNGPSGGPNWNVIEIYKAAAPALSLLAPDIYNRDHAAANEFVRIYARPDNPLMVPEIGNAAEYARFFWPTLGRGAIGFAPFGMDATGYYNYPLGAKTLDDRTLDAFGNAYAAFAPIARDWARIAFTHPTWGIAKAPDNADQSTVMGRWKLTAQFGQWQMGDASWTWIESVPNPVAKELAGGAVVAHLGEDEFLVSGADTRVRITLNSPAKGESTQVLSAEEGTFVQGKWVMARRWNGDQIDHGFNFTAKPVLLKIKMGTYR